MYNEEKREENEKNNIVQGHGHYLGGKGAMDKETSTGQAGPNSLVLLNGHDCPHPFQNTRAILAESPYVLVHLQRRSSLRP